MKLYKLTLLRLKTYFKKPTLILALLGFLVLLWATLTATSTTVNESLVLPIAVVDLDQTDYSELILQRVSKKDTISIQDLSEDQALKQVSTGKIEAVYILKEGLMNKIIDGDIEELIEVVKSPVSLSSKIIGELFAAEVMRLSSNADAASSVVRQFGRETKDKDKLWDEAWALTDLYWQPSPLITIDYHSINNGVMTNEPHLASNKIKEDMMEILLLSLLMFSILIGSSSLLTEKNNGIIKRVITTGVPLWIYILSNVLFLVILHTLSLLIIMIVTNSLLLGGSNLIQRFAFYLIYMFWSGALGIIIIAFTKKMQQLLLIIPFVTLLNSLLIWKFQGYNGLTSNMLTLIILSIVIFTLAIKYLNIVETGE